MPLFAHCPQEAWESGSVESSVGEDSPNEDEFRFQTVGEQLKAERERQALSLSDLAAQTRVPMRHLDSIEKSDFSSLPGSTYTLGFARSYARALAMDATKLSSELREEMTQSGHQSYQVPTQNYEPADPSRVPSRTLAWTAAVVGVVLIAAYLIWRSSMIVGGETTVPAVETAQIAAGDKVETAPVTADPALDANGEVVLTATGAVWVKIYDADNKRLFESEMVAGDKYSVPKDANNPMIVTGRPNAISVSIGGKPVPPLGTAELTIVDVGISAASLLARKPETANAAGKDDNAVRPAGDPRT
jgi:cytoskeleton protein RodZ